ncbi:MAG: NBR1-Ig-like domain-containing protein [Patescibacteria group bacterium]|jgi:hypothetical protein
MIHQRQDTTRRGALYGSWLMGVFFVLAAVLWSPAPATASSFNPSILISDGEFTDVNAMSVTEVQRFLDERGGFLASFSEGGRSAAQIIWDAARGKNEAAGSWSGIVINETTGTVSPKVLLVTLQKEQSLLTMKSYSEAALRTAMGYGCPDSGGCNEKYAGFTKQVENAAWQLRFNYERAQGHGFSDYQVGQSFCMSDWNGTNCGTYGNRATASLYRYTPHVYNGNYNFWNMFYNTYHLASPSFAASYVTQGPWNGAEGVNVVLAPGETTTLTLTMRNAGSSTWSQGGAKPLHLGAAKPNDRCSSFLRSTPYFDCRRAARLNEASVAPGATGTFTFEVTAPSAPGTYEEGFRLVQEGVAWFGPEIHYTIRVAEPRASYVTQGPWNGAEGVNVVLAPGETTTLTLTMRNASQGTWSRDNAKPIHLGAAKPNDRCSSFLRSTPYFDCRRAARLNEASVAPGATGTFTFEVTAPSAPGTYEEGFRLVQEGVAWFGPEIHYTIRIR